jgi:hypothetical protein
MMESRLGFPLLDDKSILGETAGMDENKSFPKTQHYVPQFLLRNFASPGKEQLHVYDKKMRRTPFFRPLSAENKMDSRGLLSWLLLFVSRSLCALKPFGKERTSRAWHHPSSLSRLLGFQYLPPKAV